MSVNEQQISNATIQIVLNGEPKCFAAGITLAQLLTELSVSQINLAVEVNQKVIKKNHFQDFVIHDEDTIEIVSFVGGG